MDKERKLFQSLCTWTCWPPCSASFRERKPVFFNMPPSNTDIHPSQHLLRKAALPSTWPQSHSVVQLPGHPQEKNLCGTVNGDSCMSFG